MVVEPFIYLLGHLFHHLIAFLQKLFDILIQIFPNMQNFPQSFFHVWIKWIFNDPMFLYTWQCPSVGMKWVSYFDFRKFDAFVKFWAELWMAADNKQTDSLYLQPAKGWDCLYLQTLPYKIASVKENWAQTLQIGFCTSVAARGKICLSSRWIPLILNTYPAKLA